MDVAEQIALGQLMPYDTQLAAQELRFGNGSLQAPSSQHDEATLLAMGSELDNDQSTALNQGDHAVLIGTSP